LIAHPVSFFPCKKNAKKSQTLTMLNFNRLHIMTPGSIKTMVANDSILPWFNRILRIKGGTQGGRSAVCGPATLRNAGSNGGISQIAKPVWPHQG
jgi:hypothetical protein